MNDEERHKLLSAILEAHVARFVLAVVKRNRRYPDDEVLVDWGYATNGDPRQQAPDQYRQHGLLSWRQRDYEFSIASATFVGDEPSAEPAPLFAFTLARRLRPPIDLQFTPEKICELLDVAGRGVRFAAFPSGGGSRLTVEKLFVCEPISKLNSRSLQRLMNTIDLGQQLLARS
jgi:hypothetical protein